MCYYSKTLQPDQFRDQVAGEDLVLKSDRMGHHYAVGTSDNKIVCLKSGTRVHIQSFDISYQYKTAMRLLETKHFFRNLIGKPVTVTFMERSNHGMAADWIVFDNGAQMHITHLRVGTRFYVGVANFEENLGINDPSIVHDHRPFDVLDETRRVLNGRCSITR